MKARDSQTETLKDVYVKALDSLPVGSEIDFDGDTSDIPAGWEQTTDVNSYSTSEIKTNKTWIDGKPIYRKVISVGGLTINTYDVDISSLNADMVFLNESVLVNNTSTVLYQFPNYYSTTNDYFRTFRRKEGNNDVVRINIGSAHAVSTNMIRLIIEYTKTTD